MLGSKTAAYTLYSEVPKAHWRISTTTIEQRKDNVYRETKMCRSEQNS